MHLTAITQREELSNGEEMFLATCPELDVVSQGETADEARANLSEAVEGLLQVADDAEIGRRLRRGDGSHMMMHADGITVPVPDHRELLKGTLSGIIRQSGLDRSLFET